MSERNRLVPYDRDMARLEHELDAAFPLPPLRRIVMLAMALLGMSFFGLGAWAFATPIERAIIAPGALVNEGKRKTITLLEPGILRAMLVREGERVVRGQALFRLDTTQSEATLQQAKAQYWGGLARVARLQAEQEDRRAFEVPPEVLAQLASTPALQLLVDNERRLFTARWEAFDGQVRVQERQIAQLQAQLQALPLQRQAAMKQLAAVQERLRGFGELARTGVGSRFRVLELQESEANYQSSIAQLAAQEAATQQSIAQAQAQLATLRLNRQQDIAKDAQDTAAQVAQAQQAVRAAEDVLARRDVLAPEDGIVANFQLFTPGSSIQTGQAVLDLVPANDRLVVEAHVAPTDIEQVWVGQRANIRLSPFRQRATPLVGGRVIYLAPDQQTDPRGETTYYVARLELSREELEALPDVVLTAGMPTENFILGERRTAASYIIAPLRESIRRSMRD